tara:strand:- start:1284 stop:1763 length:480 start_codon:yes stop_codon:yes gene_type:complete
MINLKQDRQEFIFSRPVKILIVVAPYYKEISDQLILGAKSECKKFKVNVDMISVPGALEIPPAIRIAYEKSDYDGFVALGCIIRGETTHYDIVCSDSSNGLLLLGLRGANIGNGILTVENIDQAEKRSNPKKMNKGGGAVYAALSLIQHERHYSVKNQQ